MTRRQTIVYLAVVVALALPLGGCADDERDLPPGAATDPIERRAVASDHDTAEDGTIDEADDEDGVDAGRPAPKSMSMSMSMSMSASRGTRDAQEAQPGRDDDAADSAACESFDDTFAAIQHAIFERHGCTAEACHGSKAAGGLDLRPDVAYANVFDVPASASGLPRIAPGLAKNSFLYQKLQAATRPGSVEIAGSPMPVGEAPVSEGELEALRIWITAGAPEKGSVGDASRLGSSKHVGDLLGACLPAAEPISIAPLEAPDPDEGVQIEMPVFPLPAGGELEVCFATYYDLSDRVPERFKSDDGDAFYINGLTLRQDANSHHLIMTNPGIDRALAHDPSFGNWICYGGAQAGEPCEPLESNSCGDEGHCATELSHQVTCSGFGPTEDLPGGFTGGGDGSIVGSQTAQYVEQPRDGVYRAIPIRGFLYYDAHAFNLTSQDHPMHSRVNLHFTDDLRYKRISTPVTDMVFGAQGTPPFEKATICNQHVMPKGAELITLGSHTHKRGERFWAEGPNGEQIYESLVYSDPVYKDFDPPMAFDADDPEARTITYCATFNNGVASDGSPDVGMVTRASTMPDRTSCEPVACAGGKIGAHCGGVDDNRSCDTSKGSNDGLCDACTITAGPTTENSMFVLMPTFIQR